MGFTAILAAEIQVGKFFVQSLAQKIKDNLDFLYSSIAGGIPANGSFETDADADGTPDNWTVNLYTGGTFALDTTAPDDGIQCAKFTDPGGAAQGGGYLDSDYVIVSPLLTYYLAWALKCSVAGVDVRVEVREYDKAKVYLSTQTLYTSTVNPTAWTRKRYQYTPAASIAYIKIRLIGGHTDTNQAGDIYFDNVDHASVVSQSELKTSTGSVSVTSSQTITLTLPGGEYGFYPQLKGDNTGAMIAQICDTVNGFTSYTAKIKLDGIASGQGLYARQRYVTASGKDHWIFVLFDTITNKIVSVWEAPDHPCHGQGGDELNIPHPFEDKIPNHLKIFLIDNSLITELKSKVQRNVSMCEVIQKQYVVDFSPVRSKYKDREIIEIDEFGDINGDVIYDYGNGKTKKRRIVTGLPAMIEHRVLKKK